MSRCVLGSLLIQIIISRASDEVKPISEDILRFVCHASTSNKTEISFVPNPFTGAGGNLAEGAMAPVNSGELLKGQLYEKSGMKYLKVSEIKRRDSKGKWEATTGEQWMPQSGGEHDGGIWLHSTQAPCCPKDCPGKPQCPQSCLFCDSHIDRAAFPLHEERKIKKEEASKEGGGEETVEGEERIEL